MWPLKRQFGSLTIIDLGMCVNKNNNAQKGSLKITIDNTSQKNIRIDFYGEFDNFDVYHFLRQEFESITYSGYNLHIECSKIELGPTNIICTAYSAEIKNRKLIGSTVQRISAMVDIKPRVIYTRPRSTIIDLEGNSVSKYIYRKKPTAEIDGIKLMLEDASVRISEEENKKILYSQNIISIESGSIEYNIYKNKIDNAIIKLTTLLSFCFRCPISIDYVREYIKMEGEDILNEYYYSIPDFQKIKIEPLISYHNLTGKKLHNKLDRYLKIENNRSVDQSIKFLSKSYILNELPEAYVMTISALETIIGSISDEIKLTNAEKKKLRTEIKSVTQEFDIDKMKFIIRKIPELYREPIVQKILRTIKSQRVNTKDLWRNTNFEIALRRAFDRRNKIVHDAHINEEQNAYADLVRIQALVEKMILKAIGIKETECWVHRRERIDWSPEAKN